MPMIWMSFQVLSAADVDRFWSRGGHIFNATALMLGTFPVSEYPAAMSAGRWFHDGYWINRYNWLADDAHGQKSLEIPDSSHEDAWKSLTAGTSFSMMKSGNVFHSLERVSDHKHKGRSQEIASGLRMRWQAWARLMQSCY